MSEENVRRLQAVYAEWAKGNFRAGRELFAPDAVFAPGSPDAPSPLHGVDAIEAQMREFLLQWNEFRTEALEFDDLGETSAGETILVTERQHGTGKSSGVKTEAIFYSVWTFRDGLVIRAQWETDREKALEAAGLSE